jgi:futalosine hydrolase
MNSAVADPDLAGATWWLMPTELERSRFLAAWEQGVGAGPPPLIQLCGFGPIAAGVVTAFGLARQRPRRVVLLGIAGSYDVSRAALGTVVEVGRVWTDAVGAERAAAATDGVWGRWDLPSEMGFPQLTLPGDGEGPWRVEQSLELPDAASGVSLLTVGIASGSGATAAERRARFGGVVVEDMEGFSVALACRLAGVPCAIWRGITNRVGDRDVRGWHFDEALGSLARKVAGAMGHGQGLGAGHSCEREDGRAS